MKTPFPWHEEVTYYEVREKDGNLLGSFYLDLHPREGKRSGAWMENVLRTGHRGKDGKWITPIGFIGANLTPSTDSQPSLLTHGEVETLFHEFGHLIHHLCGKVDYASLNGCNVAWDFVELPSQLLENWIWEREAVDAFARHYQDGSLLPEELFTKMRATRNHHVAIATMRQLSLQKMDLDLHLFYNDNGGHLDEFIEKSIHSYTIPYEPKPISIIRQFLHLFSSSVGYAAGYYSYKWAEVLDADVFSRFQEKGIFNEKIANELRQKILERGNSEPADKLFFAFMGRNPDSNALLRRYDLLGER